MIDKNGKALSGLTAWKSRGVKHHATIGGVIMQAGNESPNNDDEAKDRNVPPPKNDPESRISSDKRPSEM